MFSVGECKADSNSTDVGGPTPQFCYQALATRLSRVDWLRTLDVNSHANRSDLNLRMQDRLRTAGLERASLSASCFSNTTRRKRQQTTSFLQEHGLRRPDR